MKVFTNNQFFGHYPVGTAAVIVAENLDDAVKILSADLVARGLSPAQADQFVEIDLTKSASYVLCDGDY